MKYIFFLILSRNSNVKPVKKQDEKDVLNCCVKMTTHGNKDVDCSCIWVLNYSNDEFKYIGWNVHPIYLFNIRLTKLFFFV